MCEMPRDLNQATTHRQPPIAATRMQRQALFRQDQRAQYVALYALRVISLALLAQASVCVAAERLRLRSRVAEVSHDQSIWSKVSISSSPGAGVSESLLCSLWSNELARYRGLQ